MNRHRRYRQPDRQTLTILPDSRFLFSRSEGTTRMTAFLLNAVCAKERLRLVLVESTTLLID